MEATEGRTAGGLVLHHFFGSCRITTDIPIAAEKQANSNQKSSKDADELEQVAGNAEDEIGERIAGIRENELIDGPESLLAMYAPMIVHICGSPHKFKVRRPIPSFFPLFLIASYLIE